METANIHKERLKSIKTELDKLCAESSATQIINISQEEPFVQLEPDRPVNEYAVAIRDQRKTSMVLQLNQTISGGNEPDQNNNLFLSIQTEKTCIAQYQGSDAKKIVH